VTKTSTVSGCHEVTSFDIQVERLPEPVITSEENSDTLCFEFNAATPLNSLTLHAGVTGAGYSYQWQRNGTDIPGATAEALTVTQEGDYTVVVTSPAPFSCVSDVSPVFEVIKSGPAQAIGTGYTVSNAFSELQTITINVQGHGTYEYRVDNGPWQSSNIFTDVTPGEHTVTVRDTRTANPCDDLVIGGVSIIDYPRYFTPNGDGYHDRWNIIGLGSQGDAKIYIFDRYGKLIKQISSGGAGWDGTMNNYPLPADDYWFTVTYKEEVNGALVDKEFKSHFALKR
jgi:gliding motility-associated-like protein